ncbi:hypothetical protein BJ322DRAFT_1037630 [Thelephora terrestris]|uniref:Protein kinase domain-containing protein n=1 Tax=Thelephora terrestris TaxID=56493 RepID=A0A9P6HNY1_9AGAM|nr:hypothetical protein BJ322DRAFT_1037630 [Thelephora terrestris]
MRVASTFGVETNAGDDRIGSGCFTEVWKGSYNGKRVATKVLHVYETSNVEEVVGVR